MFKALSSVSLAFIYVNIVGYVFHFFISRHLGPEGYGEFMVLYSFMLTVGYTSSLLGTVSIKTTVENMERRFDVLKALRFFAFVLGLCFLLTGFVFSGFLRNFLHVSDAKYFWFISFSWLFMFLATVEKSFLQATGRFPTFAFLNALEFSLRLTLAIFLILFGFAVMGALASTTIALVFICLFCYFFINKNFSGQRFKLNIKKMLKTAIYVSPSGFFVYADDIFIRRIFDSHTAGLFASVSIVGKVLVWFTLTLLGVYFPKFVEAKHSKKAIHLLFQFILIILLSFVCAELIIFILGKPLFLMLFGKAFFNAYGMLGYYVVANLPMLVALTFIAFFTATERALGLIYLHLIVYYGGFIVFPFVNMMNYFYYIFTVNTIFVIIYILNIWQFYRGCLSTSSSIWLKSP